MQTFAQWGQPARLRVDNGWPWGHTSELPPVLSLWLWGCGIEIIWNPPGHPQANGVVERFNGLLDQWGEPERCADWEAWVTRLRWLVRLQREEYPVQGGQSRRQLHPELSDNPRRYTPAAWDLGEVQRRLAPAVWPRRVDKVGRITIYGRGYGVGRSYLYQTVYVRYAPGENAWVIQDAKGQEIIRHPAVEVERERILALEISGRKPHHARQATGPNLVAYAWA